MIERKIKELSIAFEALSRINDPDAAQCMEGISELLKFQIGEAQKENHTLISTSTSDDDLPF